MAKINLTKLSTPSKVQSGQYKKTMKCFFFQSRLFEAQITELFDELWPTVTAIKNLRWQVTGYYHEMDVKQNAKLSARFVDSDDKSNRPNLYRACIEQTWEQQEFCISRNLLTNIFALYEGWIENILPKLSDDDIEAKKFQFPVTVGTTLTSMQQHENTALVNAMYSVYVAKNSSSTLSHIDNYLKVYRYFKECRNCIIHSGGRTNQTLINAYNAVSRLTATDLDVIEVPEMKPVTAEDKLVELSLRGVVGFSQIVIKIVEVLDMEFIKADKAIDCFVSQITEFTPYPEFPSSDDAKAKKKIETIMRRSGFLLPHHSDAFYLLLKNEGILL